ncbi:MAG: HNH endonuclease [Clostridia bacterium]|nr:HNH endonuclease [Clostridia bacterium]
MGRYYRRKRKTNKISVRDLALGFKVFAIIFILGAILSIINNIINFIVANIEDILVIFAICISICLIYALIKILSRRKNLKIEQNEHAKKYKEHAKEYFICDLEREHNEYICNQNSSIQLLLKINKDLEKIEKQLCGFDLRHAYDNDVFYNTISEEDYLIYNLVYTKNKVLKAIDLASNSKTFYEESIEKIKTLREDIINDAQVSEENRQIILERFDELDRYSTNNIVNFFIDVVIVQVRINGDYVCCKERRFFSSEILELIKRIENQEKGFYKDDGIWQAISRVERGKVSNKMRFAVYKRDKNRCVICGSRENLEVDHIHPIAKGGKTTFDNLQTLCHNCNVAKSDTVIE